MALILALLSTTAASSAQPRAFTKPLPIEKAPVLPAPVAKRIGEIKSTADKLVAQKRYPEALKEYWRAFDLLPRPEKDWRETTLLLAAIGEANFLVGNFEACRDNLSSAMHSPGAIGTPSIHLRLGACLFELGDRRRARDELARAYLPAGTSVFRAEDEKYLNYIKTQLDPPPGGWPRGW
jgi:tetratricopeptide (TPR) repeat protein